MQLGPAEPPQELEPALEREFAAARPLDREDCAVECEPTFHDLLPYQGVLQAERLTGVALKRLLCHPEMHATELLEAMTSRNRRPKGMGPDQVVSHSEKHVSLCEESLHGT